MARDGARRQRGGSSPFDADDLLEGRPEEKRAADLAEVTAAAGELVRRLRTARGISQAELAAKIGSTQAHLSELERGLGPHGPTVAMLARIVQEFGDTLVIETKQENERREAALIGRALLSVGELTLQLMDDLQRHNPTLMILERWLEAANALGANPFARMLTEGITVGMYMASQWWQLPDRPRREMRNAVLQSIEKKPAAARQELTALLVGRSSRG